MTKSFGRFLATLLSISLLITSLPLDCYAQIGKSVQSGSQVQAQIPVNAGINSADTDFYNWITSFSLGEGSNLVNKEIHSLLPSQAASKSKPLLSVPKAAIHLKEQIQKAQEADLNSGTADRTEQTLRLFYEKPKKADPLPVQAVSFVNERSHTAVSFRTDQALQKPTPSLKQISVSTGRSFSASNTLFRWVSMGMAGVVASGFLNPNFLLMIPVYLGLIVPSLILHEMGHAWMANKLGDPTAKNQGRMSFRPKNLLSHIHPIWTLVVPIVTLMTSGLLFGGARPVPVNSGYFRNPTKDMAKVAIAGPAVNFGLALLTGAFHALLTSIGVSGFLPQMVGMVVWVNVALGMFNLLPFFPLDGHHILRYVLSDVLKNPSVAYKLDAARNLQIVGLMATIMFLGGPLMVAIKFVSGLFLFGLVSPLEKAYHSAKKVLNLKTAAVLGGMVVLAGFSVYNVLAHSGIKGLNGTVFWLGLIVLLPLIKDLFYRLAKKTPKGAPRVDEKEHPELYKMVRELSQKAGLKMPELILWDMDAPNAAATGVQSPVLVTKTYVLFTKGILKTMSPQELTGVIGHELSHIRHQDILLIVVSKILELAVWLNAFSMHLPFYFAVPMMIGIVLLSKYLSRIREYLADAGGAILTGRSDWLAGGLLRLGVWVRLVGGVNREPVGAFSVEELSQTHPSGLRRVEK
ncbi:MAG: M48 family metalloprotease, partial [Elusimicrobia bacterium]|nr:M48 family metalloprotease [Elusimicrobiota bacterium]